MRTRTVEVAKILRLERAGRRLYHFVSGSSELTSPFKEECEDTHFYHRNGIGVFDGVGSWAENGVSPRNYSQLLMRNSLRGLREGIQRSVNILHHAWTYSKHETGATTALMCLIKGNEVNIANVGDCQMLHIRDGDILWRSVPQHHRFNCPFQLGSHSKDEPLKIAKEKDLRVRKGDIFVAGTDGLFDNLNDESILRSLESVPCTNIRSSQDGKIMSYDSANNGSFIMRVGRREMSAKYVGYLVGRHEEACDLVCKSKMVSRKHCVFSFHDPNIVTVTDISSRHGTFLNGERLPIGMPSMLSSDDVLTLGTPCVDTARKENLPVFECSSSSSRNRSFDIYKGDGEILTRRAQWLSSHVLRVSLDNDAITPFSTSAAENFGSEVSGLGGKMDDITIVIARVAGEQEETPKTFYSVRAEKVQNVSSGNEEKVQNVSSSNEEKKKKISSATAE
jgi:serine/threonine protein phosphatase PrpC